MPCKCTQSRKVRIAGKSGVYQYTFKCTTDDGRTKTATLVQSDDRMAKRLAEIKCDQAAARE